MHLVAAAAILAGAAHAQMTCQVNGGNPAIIRVEGSTELAGDLLLVCTGGTPTASGQPVPLVNITLNLNSNITSRLVGGNYTDALLTVDDPYPSNPITASLPYTTTAPANSPAQALCYSTATAAPGSCNYLLGTGGGGYGTSSNPYLQSNAFTIYAAQQDTASQITWYGVPIDPPGPLSAERMIRLTNARVDATSLGLSHTLMPTQVVANVTIDNSLFTINNPQQTIAYIQQGMDTYDVPLALCNCTSHNASLVGGNGTPAFDGTVEVREGFADVFMRRNIGVTTNGTTAPAIYPQNVPGAGYSDETGFLPSPSSVSNPNYTLQPADSGTRILVTFANIPAGVHVFVPVSVALTGGTPYPSYPPGNSFLSTQMELIQTEPNGFSGQAYTSLPSTAVVGSTPVAEASRMGSFVYATYEVVDSDPASLETADIPIALAFNSSTPLSGTIVARASLAPISSITVAATDSEPIPRFGPTNITPPPVAGDFDSSGVPDRVWEEDATGKATLHYTGYTGVDLGTWNWLNSTAVPTWHIVGVADFNGDGVPDLVWQDSVTREVVVHYEGGAGGAVLQSWKWLQSSAVPGWTVEAVADFNGDGVPDLVWQEDATGKVVVHYYGGSGGAVFQGWNWLQSAPVPGWTVVGAGDFNRDGVPDLVWQSSTTGQVTVHYYGGAGGAVLQSWNWLNKADGPQGWTVKAVSDVNGDGVPDLLWQNSSTHQVTVHYYGGPGGASMIGWNWISQAGVPGWSVVH